MKQYFSLVYVLYIGKIHSKLDGFFLFVCFFTNSSEDLVNINSYILYYICGATVMELCRLLSRRVSGRDWKSSISPLHSLPFPSVMRPVTVASENFCRWQVSDLFKRG